jgi:putative ABC transport system substrate-binding protein
LEVTLLVLRAVTIATVAVLATPLAVGSQPAPRVSTAVATRAARDATRTIPIVMAGAANPVAEGLIASLARPGGNGPAIGARPRHPTDPVGYKRA